MAVTEQVVALSSTAKSPHAALPIVEASNVDKRYDTGQVAVHALRGVSFKVERGEMVGFLGLRPGHFYKRDFIDLLYVAPHRRHRGAGRALMWAALRNASTPRVFVSTNESNTPMRQLLGSEGWILSGVLTGLDEGDPEHVFFHDVSPG